MACSRGSAEPRSEPRFPSRRGPRRRAWLIAGVAAAVLAATAGTYALIRSTHHEGPTSGAVMADRAQALSIEGVKADLDPGADVRWTARAAWFASSNARARRRGASRRLEAGDRCRSHGGFGRGDRREPARGGADERDGCRVIGASALTAAAVAMVTVVVYEGHVKVSRAGQRPGDRGAGQTYQVMRAADATGTDDAGGRRRPRRHRRRRRWTSRVGTRPGLTVAR